MSEAVHDIIARIERLPASERLELETHLAQQAEAEWQREAAEARKLAKAKGINQVAIDRAIEEVRHGS